MLDLTKEPYTDSPERAARALYEVLYAEAEALGQKAEQEVTIRSPSKNAQFPDFTGGKLPAQWAVFWEACPNPDWGVIITLSDNGYTFPETGKTVRMIGPDGEFPIAWFGEPFYGFDVHFNPKV